MATLAIPAVRHSVGRLVPRYDIYWPLVLFIWKIHAFNVNMILILVILNVSWWARSLYTYPCDLSHQSDTSVPRRTVWGGLTGENMHWLTVVLTSLHIVPGVREGEVEVNLPTDGQGEEEGEDQLDQAHHVGNYSRSEVRRH